MDLLWQRRDSMPPIGSWLLLAPKLGLQGSTETVVHSLETFPLEFILMNTEK